MKTMRPSSPAPAPVTEPLKVKRMYPSPEEYARQHPEVLADERPEAELKGDAPATGRIATPDEERIQNLNAEVDRLQKFWDQAREHWQVALNQRDAALAREREFRSAAESFRDSVLHDRGPLAENGMTSEQSNDVLGLFDDTIGAILSNDAKSTAEQASQPKQP